MFIDTDTQIQDSSSGGEMVVRGDVQQHSAPPELRKLNKAC
jgi:hypothetical protein